jgi:tetrahydromethanopterin S-methyltransferase subunit B
MKKMIQDMLASSLEGINKSTSETCSYADLTKRTVDNNTGKVVKMIEESATLSMSNIDELTSQTKATKEDITSSIHSSEATRSKADARVATVKDSVSTQLSYLVDTMQSVVDHVDHAVAEGCNNVSNTSKTGL